MRRMLFAAGALTLLAACESTPYGAVGGGRVDLASGSMLAGALSPRARDALYAAFVTAVETGPAGAPVAWSEGGASGAVTPEGYFVGNLKPDPSDLLPLGAAISFADALETEQGLHAVKSNANVRSAPTTEAKALEQLPAGTPVDAVGRAAGKPWFLVSAGGAVRGYVHQSLLVKAPGTELDLAGGPTRRAHLCRAFSQTLSVDGRSDRWSGVACDRGQGWRVEPEDPRAPERLY